MIKKVIPLKLALERDLICLKTTFILKCGITSCLRDFMTHRFFGCPSTGPTLPSSDPRQTSWGLDANLKLNLFTEARFPDTLTRQIRVNWEQICFHICRKFSVKSKIGFTFQEKFYFPNTVQLSRAMLTDTNLIFVARVRFIFVCFILVWFLFVWFKFLLIYM